MLGRNTVQESVGGCSPLTAGFCSLGLRNEGPLRVSYRRRDSPLSARQAVSITSEWKLWFPTSVFTCRKSFPDHKWLHQRTHTGHMEAESVFLFLLFFQRTHHFDAVLELNVSGKYSFHPVITFDTITLSPARPPENLFLLSGQNMSLRSVFFH